MLFLYLLTPIFAIQEIEILIGQSQIIEYYSQQGIILQQNLTYDNATSIQQQFFPCNVIPQKLINHNMLEKSMSIIPQYLSDQFSQYFDNGHYFGHIPKISSFVNINNDVIILTNQAELIYIRFLNETFIVSDKINLNINQSVLHYPVFMEAIDNQLIIILYANTIGIEININSTKIFSKSYRIYESFNTEKINSLVIVKNFLFFALGSNGIKIFQFNNYLFSSIEFQHHINNVTDLKVFYSNDVFYIYLLDYDYGVNSYIYNQKTSLIYKNEKFTDIPYPGDTIDIYNGIMMIAHYGNFQTIIQEIEINHTDYTWKLVRQHELNFVILEIIILDHLAIILAENGYTIIYHSIPSPYEIPSQHFTMPYIQKISFFKQDSKTYLIGVSQHLLYYTKLEMKSSYLQCYFEKEEEIKFSYSQLSTQCKKTFQDTCTYNQDYYIKSIKPVLTTDQNYIVYMILSLIVLAFITIITILIKEFNKYQEFVVNLEFQPRSNEITMQTFESPTKIINLNKTGNQTSQFSIISNISRMQQLQ